MDAFSKFQRRTTFSPTQQACVKINFQILCDDCGAYLQVVDRKGKLIEDVNYRYYHGSERDVLKALSEIEEATQFQIGWEGSSEKAYFAENENLLWILVNCENLVDSELKPIRFSSSQAALIFAIEECAADALQSRLLLSHDSVETSNLLVLTRNFVLSENVIYSVKPLNENFIELAQFATSLGVADLENYLSLLCSHTENVDIRYLDYKVQDAAPKATQMALVFEKVDHEQSLYLRISMTLEGVDEAFFQRYELHDVVSLNEMERMIDVHPIIHQNAADCFQVIQSLLKKYKRGLKGEEASDFVVEENLFIIEKKLAQEFIHRELAHLAATYTILGAEQLKSYKVRTVMPKLKLSLNHGIDFLEGGADLDIEGEQFSLFDALSQYRKTSYIKLNDGTHALLNQAYVDKLERLFKKKDKQVSVSFFDLPAVEELIEEKTTQPAVLKSRAIFEGFNKLKSKKVQLPKVNASLRPYQKQGYKWMNYLRQHQLGGCLADDMGLGKTLQAITLLSSIYPKEKRPSLIIMPRSLIFNWQQEIARFNPSLTSYVYYGNGRDMESIAKHHLTITTYGMLRNNIQAFQEIEFAYVVLDESQNIKNIQSQTSKAVMLLQAEHRLALSGTPIENNLGELYALFRFLNPAMFGSVDAFNQNYLGPIQQAQDKEVTRELRAKISPFILRRLKSEVLKDLPDKVEQTVYIEMSPEQSKLYNERCKYYRDHLKQQIAAHGVKKSQFYIFQAMNELRQIASIPEAQSNSRIHSPKREVLMERVIESVSNRHKVLIFCNYLSIIEHVGNDLSHSDIDYLAMTGATKDRQSLVERFQTDDSCSVFLMTLKTGGLGLNLTQADTIFIFDPWWNLAAENQAIDRAHRIGQEQTVFSYKMITRGTIEEKILQLQERKRELFDSVISSDSASIKSLDEDDINFILNADSHDRF